MIDRMGRKKCYTIGSLLMAILPVCYLTFDGPLASFYIPLLLIRILHGIGLAISFTAAFTYAADIIPKERLNEGLGAFGISGLTGMAVGPIFAELVIRSFGFNAFFLTAAGEAALGFLIHLPLPESYVRARGGEGEPVSFFAVLRKGRIITVALVSFLFGFGLAGAGSFVAPFASQQQLSFISIYFISYSSAAILARLFGGRFADRAGERRIIPFALTATGGGILMLLFLNGNTVLALSGFMTGFGHGFLYPSLSALAIREEPATSRGKVTGVFTGSVDAGIFVGSVVLGYIGEYGGFRMLFLIAGLALLAGLIVFKARSTTGRQPLHGFYRRR
jgi:MFS family permease